MQGRLKYLGVQEPSLDAIYTRYFDTKAQEEASAKEGARHGGVRARPFRVSVW